MKLTLSSRLKMPNLKSTSRAAVIKRRTLCRATVLCVFCVASWITDQMSIPGACSTRWTFMPCYRDIRQCGCCLSVGVSGGGGLLLGSAVCSPLCYLNGKLSTGQDPNSTNIKYSSPSDRCHD